MQRPWLPLALLFALLCTVTAVWETMDRRPPEWDHAIHLERAVECYRILSEPGHDRLREILDVSSFYPPLTACAAGLLYFVLPIKPLTAQAVMLGFLGLGLAATFALGRRLFDAQTGLLAAFFLGTAPFVVFSLTNFQLDLPLMGMVAVALYALLRTEAFSQPAWCALLGVVIGLGMVTKPPFAAYILPASCWTLWQGLRASGRRRRLCWLTLAIAIGIAVALPWYGPRILGLPMQAANRSFKFAAQEAQAEYLSAASLLFYPRVLPLVLGLPATLLFIWGIWAVRRVHATRVFLWLAVMGPFVMFSLIQNRNLRYLLPILPSVAVLAAVGIQSLSPAWRPGVTRVCVVLGVLQVSMASFAWPVSPYVPGLPVPLGMSYPPSGSDWRHESVIADLVRVTGGRPATVAVVPNYNFFSVSNFRYDAARLGLPFRMTRGWSGPPLGVDFVILKTGSQGPSWSVEKPERLTRALAGDDPYLADIFLLVGEYPLPDGSVGSLRQRVIHPLEGVTPAHLAARLSEAPATLLRAYVRDPVGLRVMLDYRPEGILKGVVDRVRLTADAAVVGELDRRNRAPLRLRDIRLVVEGLVFNPRRLMETGDLEVLDLGALRIERAAVTQDDLDELLRGQPGGAGVVVQLGEGSAEVRMSRAGPRIEARVRLIAWSGDRPTAVAVDSVRVGGIRVPIFLTDWIMRHFDPTLALRRLPMPVTIAPVKMTPGRIEIGG